jgi:hypothetical protein
MSHGDPDGGASGERQRHVARFDPTSVRRARKVHVRAETHHDSRRVVLAAATGRERCGEGQILQADGHGEVAHKRRRDGTADEMFQLLVWLP